MELVVDARLLLFARERLRVAVLSAAGRRRCDDKVDDKDDRRVVFVVDVPRRPVEVARVLDWWLLFGLFDNLAGLPARDDDADDRRLVLTDGLVRLKRVLHCAFLMFLEPEVFLDRDDDDDASDDDDQSRLLLDL